MQVFQGESTRLSAHVRAEDDEAREKIMAPQKTEHCAVKSVFLSVVLRNAMSV